MKIMQVFGTMIARSWMAAAVGGALWLSGCASYEMAPGEGYDALSSEQRATSGPRSEMPWNTPVAQERPGLGTGWGRQMKSEMDYTTFARASSSPYGGPAMVYYNDKEGVKAMARWKYSGKGMQKAANGLVEWGVKGTFGMLKNYQSGGRRYVEGRSDQRYSLVVKNLAKSRLEIALSVDGLDVLDGKTAGYRKRGYIVAPGQTLEVKGWRTSQDAVAAFKFSSVSGSYSNLKGSGTRNVGVIGMAVFTEKGVDPFTWMPAEVKRREAASPFAEPPMRQGR